MVTFVTCFTFHLLHTLCSSIFEGKDVIAMIVSLLTRMGFIRIWENSITISEGAAVGTFFGSIPLLPWQCIRYVTLPIFPFSRVPWFFLQFWITTFTAFGMIEMSPWAWRFTFLISLLWTALKKQMEVLLCLMICWIYTSKDKAQLYWHVTFGCKSYAYIPDKSLWLAWHSNNNVLQEWVHL